MGITKRKRRPTGHIVRRGGSFYVPVYLGRERVRDEATGEERWKERRVWKRYASRHEARQAIKAGLFGKAAKRALARTTKARMAEYLPQWLAQRLDLEYKTRYEYEKTITKHLIPAIGHLPLSDIEPQHISHYLAGKKDAGFSPATVRRHFNLLRAALRTAVETDQLETNPAVHVKPPKQVRATVAVLEKEQLQTFLGTAKQTSRYYRLYLMAVLTGLRQAELCGLTWEHVDLRNRRLFVQKVFYRVGGRAIWKEYPKTDASRKALLLPPGLVKELSAIRREQEARQRELGERYEDHGLVFAQDNGKPLHAHNIVRRDMRKVLEQAGLPRVTFHSLRHATGTQLSRMKAEVKDIQGAMRHSRASTTLDLYVADQSEKRVGQVLQQLERRLLGSSTESSTETVSMPLEGAVH